MTKFKFICSALAVSCCVLAAYAQPAPEFSDDRQLWADNAVTRTIISIPDIPGYVTLKGDFHIHTDFADAQEYPAGRVREAWCDGLDILAMTEHIGTQKNTGIKLEDMNLPYEIAKKEGKKFGLIVIHGAEITRTKPFGHMNALFIKDGNKFEVAKRYLLDDKGNRILDENGNKQTDMETLRNDIEEMYRQGAFILWNHPGWPDRKSDIFDIQKEMIAKGKIHGMELCNALEWYPKVLDYFDEYHIPMFANSDMHNPSGVDYKNGEMRPITLVFAKERTEKSVKEAMFAGRIVAFFAQRLAGDKQYVEPLVHACLKVTVLDAKKGVIIVENNSDIKFDGVWRETMAPSSFYPHTARRITLPKGGEIEFVNCFIGREHLKTTLW